jgi:hypothetical protein
VRALREGEHLDADAGVRGCLDQAPGLPGHDGRAADLAPQRGLVKDGAQAQRVLALEDEVLAAEPDLDALLDLVRAELAGAGADDGARVGLGLELAGDGEGLEDAERLRGGLQPDVGGVGAAEDAGVGVPPALLAGLAGQADQRVADLGVGDRVQGSPLG